MDKKQLEIKLSKLLQNEEYSRSLEQYPTPTDIVARILWVAQSDILNKKVADFGCGNGVFAIGASLLGAKQVYAIEKDEGIIDIAKENAKKVGLNIKFLNEDVINFNKKVDTVIMNPPFGDKKTHKDRFFLEKAMSVANKIYSIHKIESDKFIQALSEDNSFISELLFDFDFNIKPIMEFHKKGKYSVKCGVWKLTRSLA